MQIISGNTKFDFIGKRVPAAILSIVLVVVSCVALFGRGLNLGIDFSGGTLVEVGYEQAVEIEAVRDALTESGFDDAVVQHFGTSRDVMVRLPAGVGGEGVKAAEISSQIMLALRAPFGESISQDAAIDAGEQVCGAGPCQVQMRRVEFVGPQVGDELTNQGGLAMLYALAGILIYVTFRFRWQFAVGSIVALAHDVIITFGAFALFQWEFSLAVLAAILAVIGYSLNDTIVVFDRIRENFRKMRKSDSAGVMNVSVNQTLPRTFLTSITTLLVVLSLFIFGGEVIRGFSIALIIGVLIGTYSSIFVASPAVYWLGVTREDMLPVAKEGAEVNVDP
ncbi:MAG: protein translocase subunit SecF [Pseudomonadota bacterium]